MLVDFGIAKIYDSASSTTAGAKAVTPGYSPPEQYGAGSTDNRSDIYAIGATLYHLLTGQPPPESVRRMTNLEPVPPPRGLNPRISPAVENAILRALEISTDRRFQKMGDFKAALTQPVREVEPDTLVGAPSPFKVQPVVAPRRPPAPSAPPSAPPRTARPSIRRPAPKPAPNRALQVVLGLVGFTAVIAICAVIALVTGLLGGEGDLSWITGAEGATDTPAAIVVEGLGATETLLQPDAAIVESPTPPPESTEADAPAPEDPASPTPPPSPTSPPPPTAPPPPTPTHVFSPLGLMSQGWSMGGGNASNTSWNAAELELYPPLSLEWEWSPPNPYHIDTVTVSEGIFYLGGTHDNDDNAVYAVRTGTTAALWRYSMPDAGGAMDVHVAVSGGLAYFGGQGDDNLYCLNALTGEGMYTRSPKVVKRRVYAPAIEGAMSVDGQNGGVIWRTETGRVQSSNALMGSLLLTGSTLSPGDRTIDLTARTGWSNGAPGKRAPSKSPPPNPTPTPSSLRPTLLTPLIPSQLIICPTVPWPGGSLWAIISGSSPIWPSRTTKYLWPAAPAMSNRSGCTCSIARTAACCSGSKCPASGPAP